MTEKLKSVLAYLFTIVGGVIVFFTAKEDEKNAKFHAAQSIVLAVLYIVANAICSWIPLLGGILMGLLWLVFLVFTIMGIVKAVKDENPELPIISEIVKAVIKGI